jgi:hypothetical protein
MRVGSRLFVAAGLALAISGCAKHEDLVATGGSRSDGIVNLSYDYRSAEHPKIDLAQGEAAARDLCRAWGYSDAHPSGEQTKRCNAPSEYGCLRWTVTMAYQCLGTGTPGKKA